MRTKKNLFNFELGTFERMGDELTLTLKRDKFRYDNIAELKRLKQDQAHSLKLATILEQGDSVVLNYTIPNGAMPLKDISKENKAIRTSIAKAILDTDIENNEFNVSLNPSNVWYYPMSNVWYAYKATQDMPYSDSADRFIEYKALVLYVLTGIPYERLINNMNEATQIITDDLIKQVVDTTDQKELKETVAVINDYVQAEAWKSVDAIQKKTKRRFLVGIGSVAVVALLAVGLVHKSGENQLKATEIQNTKQLRSVKYESALQDALNDKDWKQADKAMNKLGYSKKKQAQTYLDLNEYQRALNADAGVLNKAVNSLYKNGNAKKLLDWKLPTNATDKQKDALKLEKQIVNYDQAQITAQMSFTENTDVLLRMGKAFLSHDDEQDATTAQNKLLSLNKDKGHYMEALIKQKKAQKSVTDSQHKLDDANKIDDKDGSKGDKVKEAQGNLDSAKKDLDSANKQVKEAQEKLG